MAHLKRKTTTRPLPAGAEIIERKGRSIAKWRGRDGRTRTAPLSKDGTRISDSSVTWYAVWTDADGRTRTENTGCKDRTAAQAWLAAREREVELERAGVVTATEARAGRAAAVPLSEQVGEYLAALEGRGRTAHHVAATRRYLNGGAKNCGFARLADIERDVFERFLASMATDGRSARLRNAYRVAWVAFCNWCVEQRRLSVNPLNGLHAANEAADRRHVRRVLTDDEFARLLEAARTRPLEERRTQNRGASPARLSEATVTKLERLGRERALIYQTLAGTGLRVSELRAVRLCDVVLGGDTPYIHLDAANTKNGRDATLPLHAMLADELAAWIRDRKQWAEEGLAAGRPAPLPEEAPLFRFPVPLTHVFDRDLRAAGIAKEDSQGRRLDVHGLRARFATQLAKAGVPLQAAQRLLRHSDPKLTANVYTLLDTGDLAEEVAKLHIAPVTTDAAQDAP